MKCEPMVRFTYLVLKINQAEATLHHLFET